MHAPDNIKRMLVQNLVCEYNFQAVRHNELDMFVQSQCVCVLFLNKPHRSNNCCLNYFLFPFWKFCSQKLCISKRIALQHPLIYIYLLEIHFFCSNSFSFFSSAVRTPSLIYKFSFALNYCLFFCTVTRYSCFISQMSIYLLVLNAPMPYTVLLHNIGISWT